MGYDYWAWNFWYLLASQLLIKISEYERMSINLLNLALISTLNYINIIKKLIELLFINLLYVIIYYSNVYDPLW